MFEETLTLQNKLGLHARPSARLAKTASLFRSTITITHEKHTVDAKSILGLMTMALPCGSVVTIAADGSDEKMPCRPLPNYSETASVKTNNFFGEKTNELRRRN